MRHEIAQPLLAILLLLPLSVSAGEVDGVNVSCVAKKRSETRGWTDYLFLSFSDGNVTRRVLNETSKTLEIEEEELYNYLATDGSVFWDFKPYGEIGHVDTYSLDREKLTIDIKSTPKDGCFAGGYGAAIRSALNGNAPRNRCRTSEEAFSCWLIDAESAEEELDYLRSKYQVLVDDRVRAEQKANEKQRKKNKI